MQFHWQNLNEDRRGRVKGLPWNGRAWLRGNQRGVARVEWVLNARRGLVQLVAIALGLLAAHALGGIVGWGALALLPAVASVFQLQVDAGDREVMLRLQLPLLTLYLAAEDLLARRLVQWLAAGTDKREWGLAFHDGAVWWCIGMNPDEWSAREPWYRRGNWHPLDTLLGKSKYGKEEIERRPVVVALPEGAYSAVATLSLAQWKRQRWFTRRRYTCEVQMQPGQQIPIPGKGENSWDCEDDAIYSQSNGAETIEQGIADLIASVLRTRHNRAGTHRPPSDEVKQPQAMQLLAEAGRLMTGPGDTWAIPPDKQSAADKWWWAFQDERARYGNPVAYVDALIAQLQDGQVMALPGILGQLVRVLSNHCGERGTSEGAVSTLQRIISERDAVAAQVVAGAVFDFLGYLTTRDSAITLGAAHDAPPAIDLLQAWAKLRGLSVDDADVARWQDRVARPDKRTT